MSCHTELEERLKGEGAHPPAEEGECLSCHNAHHSTISKLLSEPVPAVCLNCHDGDDDTFKAKHLGLSGDQIDCRKCHDPHASHTSGLILENSHDPFSGGACDACHKTEPGKGEKD